MSSEGSGVTSEEFRRACGRFANGVTIATVLDAAGSPHGLTVSSFTSVSLDPPLILICIGHAVTAIDTFRATRNFGINILAEDQQTLSERFARKGEDRFDGLPWYPGSTGVPLIPGVLAAIECTVEQRIPAGDHDIFVARIGGRPGGGRRAADPFPRLLPATGVRLRLMSNPLSYLHDQLESWRQEGTFQRLRVLETACAPESRFDGKQVINLASNNYLGLTTHPKLREAALEAVRKYGAGSGAVRTISGTMSLHMELEERIAAFKHVEACVVFQSGFAANAGTVSAILTPEDHIISDELNHASIIDGCRLSRAKIHVFPHKDVAARRGDPGRAGRRFRPQAPDFRRRLLDGWRHRPAPGLVEAAEKHGAIMMVDDAHSSGVLGRNGRGTIDHFGLHGRVHIQVGTLSKAVGVLGGYVCGSRDLIEFLYHRARPFLFSTSHPPAVAAACLAAFDVLEQEPERIQQLWDNTRYFKQGLVAAGFDTGISETPITPVMVGEAAQAHQFSRELFEGGVLATGIGFPTVPKGRARIRTIVTATHTREELDRALGVFEKVGRRMGLTKPS